jgi:2-polyprenyl-6-methoxyphenol hydroxylase-like FAD-dependent oxidoreductase
MAWSGAKAIIVGAGPGGLTAAIALRRVGIEPLVCERAAEGHQSGVALTLWPNALQALDRLGLGDQIRRLGLPFDGLAMSVESGGELFRVERATLETRFGDSGLALLRAELIDLLQRCLGEEQMRFNTACVAVEQNASRVTARFADGSAAEGSLLIGADGIRSNVRRSLFGDQQLRCLGYAVWRGIARTSLAVHTGQTMLGRGLQFGFFPLSGDRVYWFASANTDKGAARSEDGCKAQLLAQFAAWPDGVQRLIECTDQDDILRNNIYDMDSLPVWSRGVVTLLGDAAHPTAPDLGQGACQAVEDAVVLAQSLSRASDLPSGLAIYESRRIGRTRWLTLLSRRVARAGTLVNPLSCALRNRAVALTPTWLRLRQLQAMFDFGAQETP